MCASVFPPSPSKWEVETLFIVFRGPKIRDHASRGAWSYVRGVWSRGLLGSYSRTFGCTFHGFVTFWTYFWYPYCLRRFQFSHEVEFWSYEMNTGLMSCLFWASYHPDNSYFAKSGYDLVIWWPILISVWVFRLVTLQRRYEWTNTYHIRKDVFIIGPFWG